jgi:hypothetical protein
MNIAFFAEPRAWAPLQGLLRWFAPTATPAPVGKSAAASHAKPSAHSALPACHRRSGPAGTTPSRLVQRRPLRIVRIMESGQPPAQVGRMVISGRMADVCAELDRLAACEAARS